MMRNLNLILREMDISEDVQQEKKDDKILVGNTLKARFSWERRSKWGEKAPKVSGVFSMCFLEPSK